MTHGAMIDSDVLCDLTSREREVLELMVEGFANPGIAERLFITVRAVEKHVTNILWKVTGIYVGSTDDRTYDRRVLAVILYLESQK